jgi:hypothetical protein
MEIKDYLKDLVAHTHDLGGVFEAVKVTHEDDVLQINAVSGDRSVVLTGKFKTKVPELDGTFGMPNLQKLKILLGIPEYQENAQISVNSVNNSPVSLRFSNKGGDFHNEYRFMSQEVVNEKLKTLKFKGVNWNIECVPQQFAIERFRFQSRANSDVSSFQVKVVKNDLVFCFGDQSTHAGEFVFEKSVTGNLSRIWSWPVTTVQSILGLSGDKMMKFSDAGACEITVDSGIAQYTYILPAMT